MATRVRFNKYLDDAVGADATVVETLPVIPDGETWVLRKFGGCASGKGKIVLQELQSTEPDVWTTIRGIACPGTAEFEIGKSVVGDVAVRYRIVRIEESSTAQDMVVWFEGYKR